MRKTIIALSLCLSTNTFAGPLWEDIKSNTQGFNKQSRSSTPLYDARVLSLDEESLRRQLLTASISTSMNSVAKAKPSEQKLLELPLPDGSMIHVVVEEYPLLAKELAAKFPKIKAWKVHAANGKNIHGRIDLTGAGFHAMLTLENGDTIFIDPDKSSENKQYNSFSKSKNKSLFQRQSSEIEQLIKTSIPQKRTVNLLKKNGNSPQSLITYRLALAATGEYTALKGGSKSDAFSAMVTTINRVNEIYERDLSIRLSLVANNDKIIYTSANSDPFTNGDAYAMLDETIATLDAVIGNQNYDIGHLFGGEGTGGLALLSGVCRANNISHKAGGITGSASPYGDSFDIDYVSHEMGHQLGATHTFNSETQNCGGNNRESDTAVEPGSGSTIMSYAGICGENNLQNTSDAVFNAVSIAQINNYLRESGEANCGVHTARNNTNPTITPPQNFTIPSNTPFILTSNANDIDGDQLSYTWDQIDSNGTTVNVGLDAGDNPLFRSYLPSKTKYRYFPQVDTLFGSLPIKGEKLALTNRELNFATTVRDNRGGIERADTKITTSGNPFTLISHHTSHLYYTNENINVAWNVAGTNVAPINCESVDIKLLAKDGSTQNLLLNTANDGNQNLTIPSSTSTINQARMMVSCRNNIFFAVSQGNIAIDNANPITSVPPINTTVSGASIIESDSDTLKLLFTVNLSHPSETHATIHYATANGTAKVGSDYIFNSGILFIPAGETSKTVSITVLNDQLVEDNETFQLQLSNPSSNINLLNNRATATIIDDDKKIDAPADKQEPSTTTTEEKKAGGSMGSIFIFLMLYISLLRLRVKAWRSAAA